MIIDIIDLVLCEVRVLLLTNFSDEYYYDHTITKIMKMTMMNIKTCDALEVCIGSNDDNMRDNKVHMCSL